MISRLESQANLIYELTAPVITITDQLGLLPIIGEIDTNRTKHILESTLKQVADLHLSTLIIDLSGVIMIDTMVAQRLFQMVEALKLLGTKTVISGIRPEVALTSVQLGIDFTALETSANLRTLIAKYI
ncbi:modulator protein RsbR [Bacillus coahuilensis m2-6]|nr:modulator protein RsbR [Bacillus coahuilensis m2-6]